MRVTIIILRTLVVPTTTEQTFIWSLTPTLPAQIVPMILNIIWPCGETDLLQPENF